MNSRQLQSVTQPFAASFTWLMWLGWEWGKRQRAFEPEAAEEMSS